MKFQEKPKNYYGVLWFQIGVDFTLSPRLDTNMSGMTKSMHGGGTLKAKSLVTIVERCPESYPRHPLHLKRKNE